MNEPLLYVGLITFTMMSFYQRIRQSEFFSNVFRLMAGNSSAQIINVLIAPVLTRLYSPEEFGVFALFMSGLTIGATVASAKYETAILLPEKNHYAWQIVGLCFIISSLIALLFGLSGFALSVLFPGWISAKLGIWIAPVIVLTSTILTINSWLTRMKKYLTITRGKVLQASTTAFFSILFGYNFHEVLLNGLIVSAILGQTAAIVYLLFSVREEIRKYALQSSLFISMARRYSDFPLFALSSEGVAALSRELPNYLINIFFGPAVLGYFSLAMRVMNLPKIALSITLGEVYVQRAAEMQKEQKNLGKFTERLLLMLVGAALICFIPLAFYGDWLFSFAFGPEWSVSGQLTTSLSPWFIFWFASSPLAYIFYIKRKLPTLLVYQIFLLLLRIWIFMALGESTSSSNFFWYYAIANAVAEIILLLVIRRTSYQK